MTATSNPLAIAHREAGHYQRRLLDVQRKVFGKRGGLAGWNRRWIAEVGDALRTGGLREAMRVHQAMRPAFEHDVQAWMGAAQSVGEALGQAQVEAYRLPSDGSVPLVGLEHTAVKPEDLIALPVGRYDFAGLLLQQVGRRPPDEAVQRLKKAKPLDKARGDLAVLIPEAAVLGVLMWLLGGLAKSGQLHLAAGDEFVWGKQAVAAIDAKTTETCLNVHGQVQPFDKPFRLVGEPKFASKIDFPPFHWHCRTVFVLYHPDYDDGLTAQMRAAARAELAARPGSAHPRPSGALGH